MSLEPIIHPKTSHEYAASAVAHLAVTVLGLYLARKISDSLLATYAAALAPTMASLAARKFTAPSNTELAAANEQCREKEQQAANQLSTLRKQLGILTTERDELITKLAEVNKDKQGLAIAAETDKKRVDELEEEVAALRQQIARLQQESLELENLPPPPSAECRELESEPLPPPLEPTLSEVLPHRIQEMIAQLEKAPPDQVLFVTQEMIANLDQLRSDYVNGMTKPESANNVHPLLVQLHNLLSKIRSLQEASPETAAVHPMSRGLIGLCIKDWKVAMPQIAKQHRLIKFVELWKGDLDQLQAVLKAIEKDNCTEKRSGKEVTIRQGGIIGRHHRARKKP